MNKGNTPTITLTLPDTVDLSQATNVYVTFKDREHKLTKTGADLAIDENVGLDTTITAALVEHYEGTTEVTPADVAQVLHTAGLYMDSDVTIQAVPSSYGRITWDGVALNVF